MNLSERAKKIIFALGFVGLTIILGYFIYILFFKSLMQPSQDLSNVSTSTGAGLPQSGAGDKNIVGNNGQNGLPDNGSITSTIIPPPKANNVDEIAKGGITKTYDITKTPGYGISMGPNGILQYYNPQDGKFYRRGENGDLTLMSDKVFHNAQQVIWSPVKSKAVIEYPDGSKIIYDFATQKQISLPEHWKNFSFSPDGNKIVMKSMGTDPSNRWLATVKSDGTQVSALEPLGDDESVHPLWSPNQQIAAVYTDTVGFNRQEVYFVGLNKENFKSMMVEGKDFRPQWSPVGDKMLYSVYNDGNDMKPSVWIVDAEGNNIGNNRANLKLETWADKCTFSGNDTVYCAVPKTLEKGAGLFPQTANNTPDTIYKVDVTTGTKQEIAIPDTDYTVTEITVSQDGKYLYFNDRNSGKVHSIILK